jgi:hypothetical protein
MTDKQLGNLCLFLLFLTMMVLKVTGPAAEVSWWWVTAPLWGPLAVTVAVGLVAAVAVGVARMVSR